MEFVIPPPSPAVSDQQVSVPIALFGQFAELFGSPLGGRAAEKAAGFLFPFQVVGLSSFRRQRRRSQIELRRRRVDKQLDAVGRDSELTDRTPTA